MFGSIGITEIIILAGIALVIMGPEKFPEFAKIVARTIRDVRGYVSEAQRDLAREMKPVRDEFDKLSRMDPERYLDKLTSAGDDDKDKKQEDEEEQPYNPEPEGPTMDNTFQYGAYGGEDYTTKEEDQSSGSEYANSDSSSSESSATATPAEPPKEEEEPRREPLDG